ncbi:MAG: dienelactone hydrolase family protein [Flavobacteriales bacterium]|nr:dienelactone hydrolase family protein [Flavobacteriales bacterium]
MKEIHIPTTKTARYFQLGEFNPSTKRVLLVCHGYAQLAEFFLKWFEETDLKHTVIIAPEGLHRFYWKGFDGRVVASWMTKEDRENDIKDYCTFLDNVLNSLPLTHSTQLVALGFSQGAATISRWAEWTKYDISHLILWAGVFPDDVDVKRINFKVNTPIDILFGDEDEFYNPDQLLELQNYLSEKKLNFKFTSFKGKHKVYAQPLNKLLQNSPST